MKRYYLIHKHNRRAYRAWTGFCDEVHRVAGIVVMQDKVGRRGKRVKSRWIFKYAGKSYPAGYLNVGDWLVQDIDSGIYFARSEQLVLRDWEISAPASQDTWKPFLILDQEVSDDV